MAIFQNAETTPDTEGHHINAHGGCVVFHDGRYYWYGESRLPTDPTSNGVSCYSSTDLQSWTSHGLVLPLTETPSDLQRGCIVERPKVVYNRKTKQFVMWFHLELAGQGYHAARAGLAVSDGPLGPFQFVKSSRLNAGVWPQDMPASSQTPLSVEEFEKIWKSDERDAALRDGVLVRRDFAGGQMSRDMTLCVDADEKAHLLVSAEENYTLHLHELDDTYTRPTGRWTRIAPGGHNEAPAVLKGDGVYHILASGCTGWAPNAARLLTAPSLWGPWTEQANPCRGVSAINGLGPELTFGAQSTFIFRPQGEDAPDVAMFDLWKPKDLGNSSHLWLPIKFEDGRLTIPWQRQI